MKTSWLFDVDGVLSNSVTKKVQELQIFNELVNRLEKGDVIGLNTGRSLDFIVSKILDPLENVLKDKNLLKSIFAIGEKGAVWVTYNKKGIRTEHLNSQISVPNKLQAEVRKVVSYPPFSDVMFYDESKKTMITIEMTINKNHGKFLKLQQQLVHDFENLLIKMNIINDFKIDVFRIATDIQSKNVGKAYATKKFTELLTANQIFPNKYICFGDDKADYQMYEELKRLGKKAKLVFVGEKEKLEGKNLQDVVFTKKHLDEGTLEYLQSSQ
jgi:hydroxymethylpyrimidine pyrophosphatase-like HAD family hydrolase